MIKQELVDRIRKESGQDESRQDIIDSLFFAGWEKQDIEDSYAEAERFANVSEDYLQEKSLQDFPSVSDLLRKSWDLYKANFETLLKIAAVPFVLEMISLAVFLYYSLVYGLTLKEMFSSTAEPPVLIMVSAINLIVGISQLWSQAALIYALKYEGENLEMREAYGKSLSKVGPFIWVTFLSSLIILGGFAFFIVPGLIFAVWFSLAYFVVFDEGLRGTKALLKSREYVRGNFYKVARAILGLFLYLIAVFTVIAIAAMIVLGIIGASLDSSGLVDVESTAEQWGEAELDLDFSFILAPFATAYTYLIYKYLKRVKGDVSLDSSPRRRGKYLGIGILGFLIILFILSLVLFFFS